MFYQIQEYFNNNLDSFINMVMSHMTLSLFSLIIATGMGVGLGLIVVQNENLRNPAISAFGILRIIPSLALLIMLIPIMGTGKAPATVALVVLAIPPILMNTVTGFDQVPEFMIETAIGQGMTEKETMRKVRFPLALPLILTGIKTAMIEIISSATLAAIIGGGGLGELIFTGLGLNRTDLIVIGGLSVATLSLLANLFWEVIDRSILKYKYVR